MGTHTISIMIATSRTTTRRLLQQTFTQTRNIQLAAKASSVKEVARVFERFDADNSNALCLKELDQGFKSVGAQLSSDELDTILRTFDTTASGTLSGDEFFTMVSTSPEVSSAMEAAEAAKKVAVAERTDDWARAVTEANSAPEVADIFSDDALLLGTVSRNIRTHSAGHNNATDLSVDPALHIENYFEYFAEGLKPSIVDREDHITAISDDVLVNNAMVHWSWEGGPTPEEPLTARMTFVFRYSADLGDVELFELHSSALPAPKIDEL